MLKNLLLAAIMVVPLAGCDTVCTCRTCKLCIAL